MKRKKTQHIREILALLISSWVWSTGDADAGVRWFAPLAAAPFPPNPSSNSLTASSNFSNLREFELSANLKLFTEEKENS